MGAALVLPTVLAGVAAGVLLQDAGATGWWAWPAVPAAAAGLVIVRGGRIGLVLLVVAATTAGLVVGSWRGAAAVLPTGPGSVAALVGDTRWQISGTLVEEPRPRGERQQAVLDRIEVADGSALTPAVGRVLAWLPRSVAVQAGDRIELLTRLDEPMDFEGFAYRAYLARQGIGAVASARQATVVAHQLGAIPEAMASLRRWLLEGLNGLVPEPEAALAAGILLGVRTSIAPEVADAFATAGLTHVVAISGWNIAIVAALAAAATRPLTRLRGGRVAAASMAAAAVGAYVLLTGASPSVVRAALMAGALVLARLGGSRAHALSALMLAALVMLLAAPPVLWDVGFQLSALATAGLIWFAAPFEARLARWPAAIREPIALTMAAQVTTLPVILLNFERLSLVAPLANVLVVPLVPIVMLASALAAAAGAAFDGLGALSQGVGWLTGGAAWLYLRAMIGVGQVAASLPLAALDVTGPPWLALAWYPMLPWLHRRLAPRADADAPGSAHSAGMEAMPLAAQLARPGPLALGTVVVLCLCTAATQPDGRWHLALLDIGQGDAILLRTPSGANLLVDGGPDPELLARRLGQELPFWERDIDVVLLSHPHEDHVAGLLAVLDRYRVTLVLDPGRAYENPTYPRFQHVAAAEPGARALAARAGMRVPIDVGTTLTFLFPDERDMAAPLPEGDINNASAVALLNAGGTRVLLTGDAEAPVEALLRERGVLEPVDVLKVGHHGSESSTTDGLLAATRPKVALISAGRENEYGHPHAVTVARLAAMPGLQVRRTDLEGTVRLAWGGSGAQPDGGAGSIGPWPCPVPNAPRRSSPTTTCRMGSWSTRGAWRGWPPRRRGWWRRPASPSTRSSSRAPPCCTTSTRPPPGGAWTTACSGRAG